MTTGSSDPMTQGQTTASGDHFGGSSVVARLSTPVWIFDIDRARVLHANAAACRLWGAATESELRDRDMGADMSSTVAKRLRQYQSDFEAADTTFSELWTLYPQGLPRSVMVIFRGHRLPDGRMAMLCEAVSEAEDQPQNVRSAEALLHTDVMITLFSRDGPPLYLNPAARNAFTKPTVHLESLFTERPDYELLIKQIETIGEHRTLASVFTNAGRRWYDISAKQCLDAATGDPAILMTAIDVSELKEARDRARRMADRDQLTGVYNRAYLQSHLTQLRRSQRADQCAILFFDVDRFKVINDRYGHDAGDHVLRCFAERARSEMRSSDLVARLGGDEFVILLEGMKSIEDVERRATQVSQAMRAPIYHGDRVIDVSVSVGIAMFIPETSLGDEVLRQADIALYASKQGGRNRVTVYTARMGAAARARSELELALKSAIARDEFVLHYQPRLDIHSNRIVAVEGLVRWQHPDKGLILPDDFIPICEETGLIEDLGRLVLAQGVRQAIAWHRAGLDIGVSLNASPRQFADPRLMETLAALSQLPGFPAGKIEIEITENALSSEPDKIATRLRQMSKIGYQIAVDDFGTGYSNLSSIWQFPLRSLKIDKSFVGQLPESGPIIRMIIALAEQMGALVVAEGVEEVAQLGWLAENRCTEAQGFLLAHPMPASQVLEFVENRAKSA